MTNRTRIRTLAPVNLPAKQTAGTAARYPVPDRPEKLERDLAKLADISLTLHQQLFHSDRSALKDAIERAQSVAGGGLKDVIAELDELDQPATRDDIASQLMRLLGSFLTNRSELDIRAREMAGDVGAQAPGRLALDIACRTLRRTLKFAPMISEMLEALEQATRKISNARCTAGRLPQAIDKAAAELERRIRDAAWAREQSIIDCARRLNDGKSVDQYHPELVREAMLVDYGAIVAEDKRRRDILAIFANKRRPDEGQDG